MPPRRLQSFLQGNHVKTNIFFKKDGRFIDPNYIRVTVVKPQLANQEFIYEPNGTQELTRLGKGRYQVEPLLDEPGQWKIVAYAEAPLQGKQQWEFTVEPSSA